MVGSCLSGLWAAPSLLVPQYLLLHLKGEEGPLLAVELQLVLVEVELQKEEQVEGLVPMLGLLIVEVKMNSDLLIMLPSILVSHHLQHSDLVRFQG